MIRFFCCTLLQNLLSTFKALEGAKQLRFLTVTGNQISTLNGLQRLQNLISLDASNNSIDHINVGKFFYTIYSFCVKWVVSECKMSAVKMYNCHGFSEAPFGQIDLQIHVVHTLRKHGPEISQS
jgi:Leucine-rich repeat (LRR) protein